MSLKWCSFLVPCCPSMVLFCLDFVITMVKFNGRAGPFWGKSLQLPVRRLAVLRASHGVATQSRDTSIKKKNTLNFSEQLLYEGCINGILFTLSVHFSFPRSPGRSHKSKPLKCFSFRCGISSCSPELQLPQKCDFPESGHTDNRPRSGYTSWYSLLICPLECRTTQSAV